jgi:hypothetical protein
MGRLLVLPADSKIPFKNYLGYKRASLLCRTVGDEEKNVLYYRRPDSRRQRGVGCPDLG